MILEPKDMEFCYENVFKVEPPGAYERLILDAILGDTTLFIRQDEVEAAWTLVNGILEGGPVKNCPIFTFIGPAPGARMLLMNLLPMM